jgi:hypothetical protein
MFLPKPQLPNDSSALLDDVPVPGSQAGKRSMLRPSAVSGVARCTALRPAVPPHGHAVTPL